MGLYCCAWRTTRSKGELRLKPFTENAAAEVSSSKTDIHGFHNLAFAASHQALDLIVFNRELHCNKAR